MPHEYKSSSMARSRKPQASLMLGCPMTLSASAALRIRKVKHRGVLVRPLKKFKGPFPALHPIRFVRFGAGVVGHYENTLTGCNVSTDGSNRSPALCKNSAPKFWVRDPSIRGTILTPFDVRIHRMEKPKGSQIAWDPVFLGR